MFWQIRNENGQFKVAVESSGRRVTNRVLQPTTATLVGGASVRFPSRLEFREQSLMSEATLAESESKSSHDSALLEGREDGLLFKTPSAWNRKHKNPTAYRSVLFRK